MTTPPQSAPGAGSTSSTQEIPVVPGAVANTQHLPPPPAPADTVDPAEALDSGAPLHATGPVHSLPEPPPVPGPATTPAGATAASGRRRRHLPVERAALAVPGLAALGVVALELGLSFDFGARSLWSALTLWSAFATAASVVGLVALAGPLLGGRPAAGAERVATGALVGLAVFWLLVALPTAASDRGFLLTAALGCLGAAVWLASRRPAAGA